MIRDLDPPQTTLQQLWSNFDKLERLRSETAGLLDNPDDISAWSMPAESVNALIDRIDVAMSKLAWLAVDIEAINKDIWDLRVDVLGEEQAKILSVEDGKRSPVETY